MFWGVVLVTLLLGSLAAEATSPCPVAARGRCSGGGCTWPVGHSSKRDWHCDFRSMPSNRSRMQVRPSWIDRWGRRPYLCNYSRCNWMTNYMCTNMQYTDRSCMVQTSSKPEGHLQSLESTPKRQWASVCGSGLLVRMLRFVVLINCYTLRADRAGGLRRIAELVANVLPDLGKRRLSLVQHNFS